MADFFDSLSQFLKKDLLSDLKKVLENPNNLSENVISYLKKNNIDLNNMIEINENEKTINCDPIKEENITNQDDRNDYDNLWLRLNNIENIMTEVQEYLKTDN